MYINPTLKCEKMAVCARVCPKKNFTGKLKLTFNVFQGRETCWQLPNSHGCPTGGNRTLLLHKIYKVYQHLEFSKPVILLQITRDHCEIFSSSPDCKSCLKCEALLIFLYSRSSMNLAWCCVLILVTRPRTLHRTKRES